MLATLAEMSLALSVWVHDYDSLAVLAGEGRGFEETPTSACRQATGLDYFIRDRSGSVVHHEITFVIAC
jgi:hypothetical protein